MLMWNKEPLPLVEYNIYREGATSGDYELVATVPYDSMSVWVDEESRPRNRSYRYKISATDIYGVESEESEVHKTMHLTISQGLGNSWNLVWTPYEGATYSSYQIYRGSDANNVELIDQFPSEGNTTYSDYDVNLPTVYYQVAIIKDEPCNVTKSNNIIRSNIATNGSVGIGDIWMEGISIYASDGQIIVSGAEGESVRVYDMMGREVSEISPTLSGSPSMRGNDFSITVPTGVYMVKVGNRPAHKIVVVK
jgi:hypothetical protein